MLANVCEGVRDATRVLGGGRTWTTGEVDEWIGFTFIARGRENEDVETDLAAFLRGAVFVNFESAALRGSGNVWRLAIFKHEWIAGSLFDSTRGMESQNQRQGDEEKCFDHQSADLS